jgi:hypothetical protein
MQKRSVLNELIEKLSKDNLITGKVHYSPKQCKVKSY